MTNNFYLKNKNKMSVYAKIWRNLNEPNEKKRDSDLFGQQGRGVTNLHKFSYTESRSNIEWTGGEIGLSMDNYKVLKNPASVGISLYVDYSYHRMYGIQG